MKSLSSEHSWEGPDATQSELSGRIPTTTDCGLHDRASDHQPTVQRRRRGWALNAR